MDVKPNIVKLRHCSLALCCDLAGSADTDSRGVVGGRVFSADKADSKAASQIPAETLIWILRENTLPSWAISPSQNHHDNVKLELTCLTDTAAQKVYFLNQNQFPLLTPRYWEKQMLSEWECSLGQRYSRRSAFFFLFTTLSFDSQLTVRPINILYGSFPAVPPSCIAVLTRSRWRGWMLVIVHELFNRRVLVTCYLLA